MEDYDGVLNQESWEKHWKWAGINKFLVTQQSLMDTGAAAISAPGASLLKKFLEPVETFVAKRVTDGFYTKTGKEKAETARPVEYYAIMNTNISVSSYLALRFVINRMMFKRGLGNKADMTQRSFSTIAAGIGTLIEQEAQAMLAFDDKQAVHKFFTNTFSNTPRGVASKREVFLKMIADYGWEAWGTEKRSKIGGVYLVAMQQAGLIDVLNTSNGKKVHSVVTINKDIVDWIYDNIEHLSAFFGSSMPMLEKPLTITKDNNSCFFTPEVRKSFVSFVRSSHYNRSHADVTVAALNKAKDVPYELNEAVYKVAVELIAQGRAPKVPVYPTEPTFPFEEEGFSKDKLNPDELDLFRSYAKAKAHYHTERHSVEAKRLAITATMNVAREMSIQKDRIGVTKFWFSYFADFRGRIYPHTKALNLQGSDLDKGLLQFHNKKPLGETGKYWLSIHGANLFGEDKVSLKDRAEWVSTHTAMICYIAENPTNKEAIDIWGKADKPFQFLGFCFEWKRLQDEGDSFLTAIPVAIDGSCNGIQNYSAMLRDPVGARATNLIDSALPADIYQEVADVLTKKLQEMDDETGYARDWLAHGINRKLTKRQVMTLPYGATIFSCNEYTKLYTDENCSKIWTTPFDRVKAASWLSPLLWEAIGDVVVKGREAMDWLQDIAKIVADTGNQIKYITPLGLEVKFNYVRIKSKKIKLRFDGETRQLRVGIREDAKPNKAKATTSIAPNFIHSLDASHLALTLTYFEGDMLCVHDSFATHAGDVDNLSHMTRLAFYDLYKDNDPLQELKEQLESQHDIVLPEPPSKGNFDLKEVLNATYFFA